MNTELMIIIITDVYATFRFVYVCSMNKNEKSKQIEKQNRKKEEEKIKKFIYETSIHVYKHTYTHTHPQKHTRTIRSSLRVGIKKTIIVLSTASVPYRLRRRTTTRNNRPNLFVPCLRLFITCLRCTNDQPLALNHYQYHHYH